MAGIHKLSAIAVQKEKTPGRYADGGGLYLQVSRWDGETVTKSWLFRYMLSGKARQMGLGPLHTVTLADAREKARQARALLLEGIDPIDARHGRKQEAKAEAAKRVTFRAAAEQFIEGQRAGWKNDKHGDQWKATLETYAYPVMGDLSVAAIDTGHVLKILEPIWTTKTETASRVRGRIEQVLDWATVRGFRRGDNPARWRGHLKHALPEKSKVRKVKHHAAMAYAELPGFMETLRASNSISARAMEFTVLTAVRTGQTIGAKWSEIDMASKVWTIPAERMKAGHEHRVPLSPRAIEILKALPHEKGNDHLFIGVMKSRGLSNMAMLEMLRGLTENGFTVHGFRSSFKDWAAEQTSYPNEVSEAALAHIVRNQTEAAYRRGDVLEKRRKLMEAWAGFCAGPARGGKNVRPLRATA